MVTWGVSERVRFLHALPARGTRPSQHDLSQIAHGPVRLKIDSEAFFTMTLLGAGHGRRPSRHEHRPLEARIPQDAGEPPEQHPEAARRKESDHLVVRFAAGPETVRAWIREFGRREVTSARKQLDETGNYHDHGTRGGLVASLALSAKGYNALGLLAEDFDGSSQSFRNGMKLR